MRWLIIMMTATGDLKRDRIQPGAVEMTQPRESDSLWMNARSGVWGESPRDGSVGGQFPPLAPAGGETLRERLFQNEVPGPGGEPF